ncbi:alpha/beta hydrolase family protein [Pseudoduganella flava]|uniref:Alpha/beta fold hydrolase n=1 Tax=Pseudoduganella flava TaxID=871742 RepID=A0A562PPV7_9BURK|nr:alpha/beta fold hydrolase [Pseudoduganella flava]QGZ37693.1 alpha/beta fold hydrolase [Pseudoduganella flava]TWI46491.1 alpha/beta hydrolase family protein [Pseudoduganella flava]
MTAMRCVSGMLAALLLAAALPAAAATYTVDRAACPYAGKSWFDPQRMECATLVAQEGAGAATYRLPALRLRRADPASTAPPVVFVNGGPGGRGVTEVADWLGHPLRQRHDIILFDPRGTGAATPRPCPGLGDALLAALARDVDAGAALADRRRLVQACVAGVAPERRADFGAAALADDIAAVGRMFGHARLNLYAVSYGTRVAQAYAQRHPQAVDRMLLDSVVPEGPYYDEIGRNYEAALERLFASCARDAACHARYPALRADYAAVRAALDTAPLRLAGGIHLDRHDFALLVQQLMYGKEFLPVLPPLFEALRRGDSGAVRLLYEVAVGMRVRSLDFGAYYLALLNDEAGRVPPSAGADDDLLFFRQDLAALTALAPPAPPHRGTPLAGPVAVVAGRFDPITAPAYGQRLEAAGTHVSYHEFAGAGHTPTLADPCMLPAVARFFAGGALAPAAGCLAAIPGAAWSGPLHAAAWPRQLIEPVVVQRSFMPLAWLGGLAALYALGLVWLAVRAVGRLRRRREGTPPAPVPPSALRRAAQLSIGAGALALLGAAGLVGVTLAGPAPALLLFGLAAPAPLVLATALLAALAAGGAVAAIAAIALLLQALWRRREGAPLPRWTLLGAGVHLCLVSPLLLPLLLDYAAG